MWSNGSVSGTSTWSVRGGRDFRFYLRPGLHGVSDEAFQSDQHLLHIETRGRTAVGGNPGTMVVGIVQNDRGSSLPPDLADAAPDFTPGAEAGGRVTLIDMDHFVEGTSIPTPQTGGLGTAERRNVHFTLHNANSGCHVRPAWCDTVLRMWGVQRSSRGRSAILEGGRSAQLQRDWMERTESGTIRRR